VIFHHSKGGSLLLQLQANISNKQKYTFLPSKERKIKLITMIKLMKDS